MMEHPLRVFVVGLFFYILCEDCHALRGVKIKVPSAVVQGQKAILKCIFDLEGDALYSVKWYRGAGEFYRYTPSDSSPIKQFKIKGFHVVESESNATQVVLEKVTRAISGPFSCEVTADQPSFFTDMKTADLEVVALPKKDPYITGLRTRYKIGDVLKANCTSEQSNPAVNIAWIVNGKDVEKPHVHKYKYEDGDYVTTYATLRLKLTEKLFETGRLKVRCVAAMHHIYHRSSEKSIELERRKHHTLSHVPHITTTTLVYPQEKWQYIETITSPPKSTLMFWSPINSYSRSTISYEANLVLLPFCLLATLHR